MPVSVALISMGNGAAKGPGDGTAGGERAVVGRYTRANLEFHGWVWGELRASVHMGHSVSMQVHVPVC